MYGSRAGWFTKTNDSNLITALVTKGTMEIKVVERGNLESAANVQLSSKVEGSTTIIKIVDEGTRAKKGQVLVELDASTLRNEHTQQQIVVKQAEALSQGSMEALEIQRTQNQSDIAASQLKLDLAVLDLEKYKFGEAEQLRNTIKGEILLAQEELTRLTEAYEFTKRLSKKGYATPATLETDRIAVTKAEVNLKAADEKLVVLEKYDYKRQIAEKEANAKEFERELDRVKRKASSAMTQAQATYDAAALTADVERTKLDRLKIQIDACTMVAPQDGLVVYANERSSRGGSQEVMIQEGSQVRERQAIINLPDVSRMRVNARIHESKIDLIEEGLAARVRVDALPGKVFNGKVDMVSLVPLSGNWPNFNLKEYSTTIAIDGGAFAEALKPGLTAEVEILVDRLPDRVLVPIQCVVERGGRHFAFPLVNGKAVRRELKIGRTNDMLVEVQDGLQEGDRVVQNPRAALVTLIADLEKEVPVEAPRSPDAPPGTQAEKPEATPSTGSPGDVSPGGEKSVEERARERAEKRKQAEQGGGGQRRGGGNFDPVAMFKQMDANSDGKLAPDEVQGRAKDNFATNDANSDGFIDQAEWTKAMEAMRARFQGGQGRPGGSGPNAGPPSGS